LFALFALLDEAIYYYLFLINTVTKVITKFRQQPCLSYHQLFE